jgi:hypothetical protein
VVPHQLSSLAVAAALQAFMYFPRGSQHKRDSSSKASARIILQFLTSLF